MKTKIGFLTAILTTLALGLGLAGAASAQRNERDIRDAIRALNSKLDDFEYNLRYQMQTNSEANTQITGVADDIRALRDRIYELNQNVDRRRDNRDDMNRIVGAALRVNETMQTVTANRRIQDDWNAARSQIDRLSANYGVKVDWNANDPQPVKDYPSGPVNKTLSVGLSGTYELDRTRSEPLDDVVADTSLGDEQRADLKEKLTAPEQIAIEVRGSQITLATSNAPSVAFIADGRDKVERTADGRTIRLRATLSGGNVLTVSSLGGDTDYTITFTSVSGGRSMKVTRRITTDYLKQTVFAESVYNKTDSVARLDIGGGPASTGGYSDNDQSQPGSPNIGTARPGNYVVPGGTVITASLENEINTKVSQNNDRFRMTVQSPNEFRGAVIEGHISGVDRSGKVTGRSNITFNFERITLRDGQTYDFAGFLQEIRDTTGKTIKVDNEGSAKGDSQTKETAKRGGIGAGAGAILGAIIGGAKGAAIGAIIGGGAGAGSVVLTGKDDIRLMPGSTLTIQSSSPGQNNPR
jgi:TolA-binding protein